MKNIYFLLLVLISTSCSVKSIYSNDILEVNNPSFQKYLDTVNAEEDNKAIVIFTTWYENDTIRLINGEKVLLNEVFTTTAQLGLTTTAVIDKNYKVVIEIVSPKKIKRINLNKEKIGNYKFIYIKREIKNRNKYTIEYGNTKKSFY